jgi:predicted nucleic-acid-binding Zn-ribbon protein
MASKEEDEGLQMRKERLNKLVETMEEIPQPIELLSEDYGDEGVVTKDRDLTPEELEELKGRYLSPDETPEYPTRKGLLKCRCKCGHIGNISDEVIEDGLSWSFIVGNDHFITLHCEDCGSDLTMFIEEIVEDELPKESN